MGRGKGKLGQSERVAWTYIYTPKCKIASGRSHIAQGDQLDDLCPPIGVG